MFRFPRPQTTLILSLSSIVLLTGLVLIDQSADRIAKYEQNAYRILGHEILDVGQPFPDLEIDENGSRVTLGEILKEHWSVIVCVSRVDKLGLDYPSILLDRYREKGLQFLYILPTTSPNKSIIPSLPGVPEGIRFAFDSREALRKRLRLPKSDFVWSFMVDPQRIVRFSVPASLSPDTLRQLTEHSLLGEGRYDTAWVPVGFSRGAKVPDVPLERVRDSQRLRTTNLPSGASTIIFFRANCTSCGIGNFLRQIENLDRFGVDFKKERIHLIFSRAFASLDLRQVSSTPHFHPDLYIAERYIPEWEDPYLTAPSDQNVPKAIFTSAQGKVDSVGDYFDWYAARIKRAARTAKFRGDEAMVWFALAALFPPAWKSVPVSEVRLYEALPTLRGQTFNSLEGMAHSRSGDLYILDGGNHRVLVFTPEGSFVRQIGGIGQGEGDLYEPMGICLDGQGRVYVIDQSSNRVQVFKPDGQPLRRFRIDTVSDSIAVNSKGEILLNTPRKGHLVTVYSPEGKDLRAFGDLVDQSRGYPGRPNSQGSKAPLGRAYIATDGDDSVYVAFQFMPLVQKYSPTGKLLWELRLDGKQVADLVRTFWSEPDAPPMRAVKNIDGIQFVHIATAACLTEKRNFVIALADQSLCVVTSEGKQLALLQIKRPVGGVFYGIGATKGVLFLANARECFRTRAAIHF